LNQDAMEKKNKRIDDEHAAKMKAKDALIGNPGEALLEKHRLKMDIGKEISKGINGRKGEQAAQARNVGKLTAQAFTEEMKNNPQTNEVEIKIKIDDVIVGKADLLYNVVTGEAKKRSG